MRDATRPNLLFVLADQLRGHDLGCAGNDDVSTPALDAFADQGLRFDRCYANSPVCTPSRATMLTGQFPLTNTVLTNDLPLPEDAPTISRTLRDAGYNTGYIGKWHLDGVPRSKFTPPGPRRHGFDFWAAYNCSHRYFRTEKFYRDDPEPISIDGYEPAIQTDLACEFLTQLDDRPFCLFLSWGPPHDPYDLVPRTYRDRYDPATLTPRPNVATIPPGSNPLAEGLEMRDTLANYYAAITGLDDQLARLLRCLDDTGVADNTIVVFTADHGDMLWSHGVMKKQLPWEESVRIPLIVRWPAGLPSGVTSDGLVSMVDLAPTLLSLLGLDPPASMDGRDLAALFRSPDDVGPESVFLMDIAPVDESPVQGFGEWRAVRTPTHTYAATPGREPWLLYDNENDPAQLVNLIDDPAHATVRHELAAELDRWLERAGDPFLSWADHVRSLGLTASWNDREQALHPAEPRLLS